MAGYPDYGEMQQGIKIALEDLHFDVINGCPCLVSACTGTLQKDIRDGHAAIVCADCDHIYSTTE